MYVDWVNALSTGHFDRISLLNICLNCLLFFMPRLTQHGVCIFFNLILVFTLLPLDSSSLKMDQFKANSFISSIHIQCLLWGRLGSGCRAPAHKTTGSHQWRSIFSLPLLFASLVSAHIWCSDQAGPCYFQFFTEPLRAAERCRWRGALNSNRPDVFLGMDGPFTAKWPGRETAQPVFSCNTQGD